MGALTGRSWHAYPEREAARCGMADDYRAPDGGRPFPQPGQAVTVARPARDSCSQPRSGTVSTQRISDPVTVRISVPWPVGRRIHRAGRAAAVISDLNLVTGHPN
jgi:hypothetical protein